MFNPMQMFGSMMGGGGGPMGSMNPMQMMSQMKNMKDPMQMMRSMMDSNPAMKRAMEMSKGKSPQQLQKTVMNLCQQRGIDFNDMVGQMRQMGFNVPDAIDVESHPVTETSLKEE